MGGYVRAKRAGVWSRLTPRQREVVRQSEAEEVDEEKQPIEEEVAQAMASVFGVTAEEIRQALEEGNFALPGEPEPGSRLLTATEILNEDSLRRRLEERFDEEVPEVIQQGFEVGLRRMDEFEAEGAFNPQDPLVQNAQRQLNAQATGITDATRRRINEVIRIAQDDPSNSVQDVAEKITEEVEGMGALPQDSGKQSRAQRIAATTTQTGFEAGQMSAMRELGAVGRKWLSTRDNRVRPGHLEADSEGQTVRLDEPFMVSPRAGRPQEARERLEFPGDPSGSPANVVNCRCTMLPILDEETYQDEQSSEPDLGDLPQL